MDAATNRILHFSFIYRKEYIGGYLAGIAYLKGLGIQGNRIKMSLPLRYGKDRLFLYCTGSSREGTLQAQVE